MLAKRYRLRHRTAFAKALTQQPVARHLLLVCLPVPINGQTPATAPPPIGFIISKKVHKSAVVRNRLKRQLREWCRTVGYPAMVASGVTFNQAGWVIVVRQSAVGKSYTQLSNAITTVLSKITGVRFSGQNAAAFTNGVKAQQHNPPRQAAL